jgi:hypothetical protein
MTTSRPLSVPESRTFLRFSLTAGHWGALVVVPLLAVAKGRGRVPLAAADFKALDPLRRSLGTGGASLAEAEAFWTRVAAGVPEPVVVTARRLFAWHVATDLSFSDRQQFYADLWAVQDELAAGGTTLPAPAAVLAALRRRVDQYLPVAKFDPETEPAPVSVPPPPGPVLTAVANRVTPSRLTWPSIGPHRVATDLPITAGLFAEQLRDWWCRPEAPRLIAANGLPGRPFAERERIYEGMEAEWVAACLNSHKEAGARECAGRFVMAVREWTDCVRHAARLGRAVWGDPRRAPAAPVERPVPADDQPFPLGAPAGARLLGAATGWRCPNCGVDAPFSEKRCPACRTPNLPAQVELRSVTTGQALTLRDGGQVGRSEYRDVFRESDAGLAASDQFQVVRDVRRGAWVVVPVGAPVRPTWCDGAAVPPDGAELSDGSVISVAGELRLVVRLV